MVALQADKSFDAIVGDMETLISARNDLPDGHKAHESLSRMINDLSEQLPWRHVYDGKEKRPSCLEQIRLIHLHGSLQGNPEASKRIKKMIDKEINGYESNHPLALSCKDIQAHHCLLKIWASLQSQKIQNKVVLLTILEAFVCHCEKPTKTDGTSGTHEGSDSPSTVRKSTEKRPWSIPVHYVEFPEKWFRGNCMALVLDTTRRALVVRGLDKSKARPGSEPEVAVSRLTHLYHSESKERIQLHLDGFGKFVVDIWMHTCYDGEDLVKKVKYECPQRCHVQAV